jgi:hypothetical protein
MVENISTEIAGFKAEADTGTIPTLSDKEFHDKPSRGTSRPSSANDGE